MGKNGRDPVEKMACGLGYRYKESVNMGCFDNPMVLSGSSPNNILHGMVEWFFLIRRYKHVWSNLVNNPMPLYELFYLCVLELTLFTSKFPLAQQDLLNGIWSKVEIIGKYLKFLIGIDSFL